ncbi:nucleotidyl transferase AbiEii/AbiGii toxin family protein [Candidatus Woesearchaeota archaeon]|nr:nucleotidyl transferase AbiEii/AbiGii toxin family protein [Candidatus Woesearchaeota archaeon]
MDFKELALKIGLPLDFTIKEFKIYELLSKLLTTGFKHPLVGGTAINKIYLQGEERFSEDLDFEVYGSRKLSIPSIEGFTIKGPFVFKRNVRFEAVYKVYDKQDKIRIDVNIKPSRKVRTVQGTAVFLTGNAITGVRTFKLEGLIARKMLAMARRVEGKDFYDLWHSMHRLNVKVLKREIKLLSLIESLDQDWVSKLLAKVKRVDWKQLRKFNNYIPLNKRPNWELVKRDVEVFLELVAG